MRRITHRSKHSHYGFWSFAIDLISLPVSIGVWLLGKSINGCTKALDTVTNAF